MAGVYRTTYRARPHAPTIRRVAGRPHLRADVPSACESSPRHDEARDGPDFDLNVLNVTVRAGMIVRPTDIGIVGIIGPMPLLIRLGIRRMEIMRFADPAKVADRRA